MTPHETVQQLVNQIRTTAPPFTGEDICTALQEAGVTAETAMRACAFAQIACGRILFRDTGVTFSNDYLCFDATGHTTEEGKLDEEPYYVAATELISTSDIGHPSLIQFASMAAEVNVINELLHRGADLEGMVTVASIVFVEPPTGVGLFHARKTTAMLNAAGLRNTARPWWKFW